MAHRWTSNLNINTRLERISRNQKYLTSKGFFCNSEKVKDRVNLNINCYAEMPKKKKKNLQSKQYNKLVVLRLILIN